MKEWEKKINFLEIELETAKNKLKFYQELEKLFEVSANITRTISSSEFTEDFISKSINNILYLIKKILNFQEAEIKVIYIKKAEDKNIKTFSIKTYNLDQSLEIYLRNFVGVRLQEDQNIVDLHKALFPQIYVYVLVNKLSYYLSYDTLIYPKDEQSKLIKDLDFFIKYNRFQYLKEIYVKLCEILNKPNKVLDIKEFCRKNDEKNLGIFFKYIISKFMELKKHPEYKNAIAKLFKEFPSFKHFSTWLKKLFLPIGNFMVVELYNCLIDDPKNDFSNEDKLKLATYCAKILEIPLTSIYLTNLINEKNLELKMANENLKKAQDEIIKLERYKRDENIAGGIAHEMGNKLFPVAINLLSLSGTGIGEELFQPLYNALNSFYLLLKKTKESNQNFKELEDLLKTYDLSIIPFLSKINKADSLIKNSYNSVRMAQDVVLKLLTFAKIKATKEYKKVDLTKTLENILERYNNVFLFEKINLKFKKINEVFISCSSDHLNVLFENLIKNAIEALEGIEQKILEIDIKEENGFALIKITDNGRGIEERVLEKIFNPFFSTKPNKGTGLGLATVERILYEYGGKIEVNSKVGIGTTFNVYIPLKNDK